MAQSAQGVEIYYSSNSTPTTAAARLVECVVDWSGPSGGPGVIDVTCFESTSRSKIAGLFNGGQMSLSVLWDKDSAIHKELQNDIGSTVHCITVKLNMTHYYITYGFVSQFTLSGSVDDRLVGSVVIEIASGIVLGHNAEMQ